MRRAGCALTTGSGGWRRGGAYLGAGRVAPAGGRLFQTPGRPVRTVNLTPFVTVNQKVQTVGTYSW